jgi:ribosomal protein L37E
MGRQFQIDEGDTVCRHCGSAWFVHGDELPRCAQCGLSDDEIEEDSGHRDVGDTE